MTAPVDLAQARRVRAGLDDLERLVRANPGLVDRLDVVADLEPPNPGEPVKNETQVSIRIPVDLKARIDVIADKLAPLGVKPAAVMRLAMIRGIEALEVEYGVTTPKKD